MRVNEIRVRNMLTGIKEFTIVSAKVKELALGTSKAYTKSSFASPAVHKPRNHIRKPATNAKNPLISRCFKLVKPRL
ncbi:hypothetical protein HYX08_01370 [Candidatus Woesearchaeota archaeon]|nr:hypothetical protein [Candidatus Woesearchaeota archaeon]